MHIHIFKCQNGPHTLIETHIMSTTKKFIEADYQDEGWFWDFIDDFLNTVPVKSLESLRFFLNVWYLPRLHLCGNTKILLLWNTITI